VYSKATKCGFVTHVDLLRMWICYACGFVTLTKRLKATSDNNNLPGCYDEFLPNTFAGIPRCTMPSQLDERRKSEEYSVVASNNYL